jgi:hypothetical protein
MKTQYLSIFDWYQLSQKRKKQFLEQIRDLDGITLRDLAIRERDLTSSGRLRSRAELEELSRTDLPPIEDLRIRTPREQTLQWFFMHRHYLAEPTERVLCRELPSCCWGETIDGKGRADLLAFDRDYAEPILVELKRAKSEAPLCAAVMEILYHWGFYQRFSTSFRKLMHDYGCNSSGNIRLLISAPDEYFKNARKRSLERADGLDGEYHRALTWIAALKDVVQIDVYTIEDQWQAKAPKFAMSKLQIPNVEKSTPAGSSSRRRAHLDKGFFTVLDRQNIWAKQRRIAVDSTNRVAKLDLNLYAPLRAETRDALTSGHGKELKGKFLKLYSSAALVVNAFDYWHDKDHVFGSSFGLTGPVRLMFESKHPVFDDPSLTPSNIDVELGGIDGTVVLECKFVEPFVRFEPSGPLFPPRYFEPENASIWKEMQSTRLFAEQLTLGIEKFERLSPEQLIKTALACRRTFASNWRFIYVWYEPAGRDALQECQKVRTEISRFREKTQGEIPFEAMTWGEVLAKLEIFANPADAPYVGWLRERYFTPAENG